MKESDLLTYRRDDLTIFIFNLLSKCLGELLWREIYLLFTSEENLVQGQFLWMEIVYRLT